MLTAGENAPHGVWWDEETEERVRIDIWIDFADPWGYLNLRCLRGALRRLCFADEVEVVAHPFFSDPQEGIEPEKPWIVHLVENEGYEPSEAIAVLEGLEVLGKAEGIRYDFGRLIVSSTSGAHRVLMAARDHDMDEETTNGIDTTVLNLAEGLFHARFEKGKDLSARDVLSEISRTHGLSTQETLAALTDENYASCVWSEAQMAMHMGLDATPTVLVNNTFAIRGAQTVESFVNVLTTAYAAAEEL